MIKYNMQYKKKYIPLTFYVDWFYHFSKVILSNTKIMWIEKKKTFLQVQVLELNLWMEFGTSLNLNW